MGLQKVVTFSRYWVAHAEEHCLHACRLNGMVVASVSCL